MSLISPRVHGSRPVTANLAAAALLFGLAACSANAPKTAPTPAKDPATDARVGLKAGLFNAGEAISNMKVTAKAVSPPGFLGITNSDLATHR